MTLDLLLKDGEIVFPGRGLRKGSIGVSKGKIVGIYSQSAEPAAREVVDCRDKWVLPGLIDPHTHIGFGSNETDFQTESRSAALGGVTGMMTFHRSDDLTKSTGPWKERGQAQSLIDFGFHFGITSHQQLQSLAVCAQTHGVTSVKVYLMYKGKAGQAKGFTEVDDGLLYAAMETTAKIRGGVVGVHCENVEVIPHFRTRLKEAGRDDLAVWDEQSPGFLEAENVFRVMYFGEKTGCPVNIVHMSSAESLEIVRRMRKRGGPAVHIETCSHYLSLTRDAGCGILGKVNPPLRQQADVEALWEGVAEGLITTIGSDHVPRKVATKGDSIWTATAGFPGIGTLLPVLLHEGVHKRSLPIELIAAATSANVARLYSIPNKGDIAVGMDADLVVVDPDRQITIDHETQLSHSDYTPYQGLTMQSAPCRTILRGRTIAVDGQLLDDAYTSPSGQYLHRS
ncbi:amidohydrolase family protein [Xinfangfangia sp. CPCC 101601]|uniref:Amidohydrolase family protein n=1 Tax=Pseudogemmobacter lacusdianii TaxID=3069608 RepID=A0ABU0W1M6_9RHOB|nr:amidohydrolase family protein [Xinfangfangia sp. CPCC 101601]MDQ2067929.1 amidohydrolase family protein [Xinfangfangia sp. CPCC 101601]